MKHRGGQYFDHIKSVLNFYSRGDKRSKEKSFKKYLGFAPQKLSSDKKKVAFSNRKILKWFALAVLFSDEYLTSKNGR